MRIRPAGVSLPSFARQPRDPGILLSVIILYNVIYPREPHIAARLTFITSHLHVTSSFIYLSCVMHMMLCINGRIYHRKFLLQKIWPSAVKGWPSAAKDWASAPKGFPSSVEIDLNPGRSCHCIKTVHILYIYAHRKDLSCVNSLQFNPLAEWHNLSISSTNSYNNVHEVAKCRRGTSL